MDKNIVIDKQAQDKIIEGANKLANIVKTTMGAKGKLVVIKEPQGLFPILTKDGITVADYILLEDPFENMGAQMIKQATKRTLDEVQDSTTTATVLTQALINQGKGKPSRQIIKNYTADLKKVKTEMEKLSKNVTQKQIKQVATIASNNDIQIGQLVAKAFAQVGRKGAIKVENTTLDESSFEVFEGLNIDSGLSAPHFATDKRKMECHLDKPYVFMFSESIQSIDDIYPVIEYAKANNRPILIMAPDIEQTALHRLILINMQGLVQAVYLRAPEYGKRNDEIMSDVAFVTNAQVQSIYSDLDFSKLGEAEQIVIRPVNTSIVTSVDTKNRIAELETRLKQEDGDFVAKRIQNLASKMAIIKVGGLTDIEQREKRDRVDDAVGAVKSSFVSGVIAGAGNTLAYLSETLELSNEFKEAIKAPMKTILENAEIKETKECYELNKGFNVVTEEFSNDLKAEGILDSSNSIIKALESAVSVANNILETNGIIIYG